MTQGKSQVNPELVEGLTPSGLSLRVEDLSKVEGSKLLSIHEFAQVCRTTPRTLRFYEKKGLFRPVRVNPNNKYRFYDPKQARDFLKIRLLQNFHIHLAQIRGSLSKKRAEEFLNKKLKGLEEEIREKEKEYKFLEKIKNFLFRYDSKTTLSSSRKRRSGFPIRSGMTNGDVLQTKTFGPFNLFCMKVEHGEYARITEYIKTLWREAKRRKLDCEKSEITFYLHNAYNPKNTPLEIALILKRHSGKSRLVGTHPESVLFRVERRDSGVASLPRMTTKNLYFKTYPKTKTLAYEYIGPYEYLILVYQNLFELIRNQNIQLKSLVFEKYKYGPLNTKSKYDYQTTIAFPI